MGDSGAKHAILPARVDLVVQVGCDRAATRETLQRRCARSRYAEPWRFWTCSHADAERAGNGHLLRRGDLDVATSGPREWDALDTPSFQGFLKYVELAKQVVVTRETKVSRGIRSVTGEKGGS